MSSGMLDPTSLITDRYTLDDVPEAMLDMERKKMSRIKMMIDMGEVSS
jgi:threonine dehydrogenase-like Zn-dependent dehydrogenase